MTTLLIPVLSFAILGLLVTYARHDRFAGAGVRADDHDELGPVDSRRHLTPRHGAARVLHTGRRGATRAA